MDNEIANMALSIAMIYTSDDISGSQNKSTFLIVVALSILDHDYLPSIFNYRYHFGKKVYRDLKISSILKMSTYQTQLQCDIRNKNIIQSYAGKIFSW